MRQRGFTLIELVIIVTIAAVLVPIIYSFAWHAERQVILSQWNLEVADAVRSVAEELRLDARAGRLLDGEELRFERDDCTVAYAIREHSLIRQGGPRCGGDRGLARSASSLLRVPGGVDLTFERALRPDQVHRTTVFIPVGGP